MTTAHLIAIVLLVLFALLVIATMIYVIVFRGNEQPNDEHSDGPDGLGSTPWTRHAVACTAQTLGVCLR